MRKDNNLKVEKTERFSIDKELDSLDMIKHIYIYILNEKSKWEQRFSNLKVEFKKRPAFLEELNNYERREHLDLDDY
jgi:hypothetical protein